MRGNDAFMYESLYLLEYGEVLLEYPVGINKQCYVYN